MTRREITTPGSGENMRCTIIACFVCLPGITACQQAVDTGPDRAVSWVRSSAEFEALSHQAYNNAHEDLDEFIADVSWSALPWQREVDGLAELPPAIITDVDETMLSNVEFQATFTPPFANHKLNTWSDTTVAEALPGAVEFMQRAADAGVRIFFLTNRPCEPVQGVNDPCPQKGVTIEDLNEAGFNADESNVLLSNEREQWDREKSVRRRHIGATHRVIMVFGDDLGDFIPCTRAKALVPCREGASISSRLDATNAHRELWGEGWYVLPNPMHGSWTSVK